MLQPFCHCIPSYPTKVPKFVNKFNHMSSCLPMNEKRILMNKQRLAVIHTITLKYDRVGHFILLLLLCRNVAVLVINLRVSYNFALLLPSSIYQRNKKSQLYKLFVSYHAYLMMKQMYVINVRKLFIEWDDTISIVRLKSNLERRL